MFKPITPAQESEMAPRPVDVREYARKFTVTAIRTLVKTTMYGRSETAKVAAANALLDRGWGKPAQEIRVEPLASSTIIDMISDASSQATMVLQTPLSITGELDDEEKHLAPVKSNGLDRARKEISKAVKSSRRRLFPEEQ